MTPLSRKDVASRIAAAIPEGSYVNLGIGAPTLVGNHLTNDVEVVLHTENGLLGMGAAPPPEEVDPDLINAGKQPVTAVRGAAYFHHADSFAMMRGGHVDICVLGAYQVSATGDLANWSTGAVDAVPAVGGAMDLATGAREVWVFMDLLSRDGDPKLVSACTYPLTGRGCVTRVYTGHGVFTIEADGVAVVDTYADATVESLRTLTGLPLLDGTEGSL